MTDIKTHVAGILRNLGLDSKEEGLRETPRRVEGYLREFCKPFDEDEILGTSFTCPAEHAGMIVQSKIPFRMICEHHLLPALGYASIGYIPNDNIVGLSKLTRLVQAVGTQRPSLQEGACDKISNILQKQLKPKGVIVVISAEHTCMAIRGIVAPGVITTTSSIKGVFRDVPAARDEFFRLCNQVTRG